MSDESWRPLLHISANTATLSDPNGLCEFRGTYHFFCQDSTEFPINPVSPQGWGHFASRDLVNWVYLGGHVMCDTPTDKDGAYSGGAYVNRDADQIWFYYTGNVRFPAGDGTYAGRLANQSLMKSYNGINMGPKQVVVDNNDYPAYCSNHVRDPNVWKQDGIFHMMLGARTRDDSRGSVLCYSSPDGYKWKLEGSVTNTGAEPFGYMWECPCRIELDGHEFLATCPQGTNELGLPHKCQNVHGNGYFPLDSTILDVLHKDTKLMGAPAPNAAIDESTFVEWDHGFDFYACQAFKDEKDRTLLIGWMGLPNDKNDVCPYDHPTKTWRGCMTVPRELTYDEASGKIFQNPVAEIDALRGDPVAFEKKDGKLECTIAPKCADVVVEGITGPGTLTLSDGVELRIADGVAELVFTDSELAGRRRTTRYGDVGEVTSIRALIDTSVLEIYLNGGKDVFSSRYYPETDSVTVTVDFPGATAVCYPMTPVTVNNIVDR